MLLSPRGGSPYGSFSPHPHVSSHPPHSHSASSPSHHFPPPSLHSSSSAESLDSSHPFHPPHLHPPSSLSSPTSASSPLPLNSPDSQWGSSGKLKQLARSIFERAYGLNGRPREDHSALCDEVTRLTACSVKSFEELVYGHSYDSELSDLRAQVPTYRPREAKKRVGGRTGKKKREDEGMTGKGPLLPLFHSPYPGATTPVSASRYELNFGVGSAVNAPRRKSLDASFLAVYHHQQGGQGTSGQGMGHHPHSASASAGFPSGLSAPFFAQGMSHTPTASSPVSHTPLHFAGDFDGQGGSHFSSTPSHSTLRHRANFSSAAAAAAAAADSVVAYVANTPTSAVLNSWTAPAVISSPKHHTQHAAVAGNGSTSSLPAPSAAPTGATAGAAPSLPSTAPPTSSQPASGPESKSLATAPLSSSVTRSTVLVSSPSNGGVAAALAASTTLAPVTLASIKSSSPAPGAGVSKLSAPSPVPSVPSDSSRSSSRSTTPLPPSPSNQPPRPVSISIPNSPSPMVSNEEEGESEGESLSLTLSGSSAGARAKDPPADDSDDARAARKRKKKEKRQSASKVEMKDDSGPRPSALEARDGSAAYQPGYLAWAPDKPGKRGTGHRGDERKDRKPFSTASVHPHSPARRGSAGLPLLGGESVEEAAVAAVEAPAGVDFGAMALPAFEAAAFPALVARASVCCGVLTLLRLYTTYVSSVPSPVDYHTALALFLALTLTAIVLLTSSLLSSLPLSSSSQSFLLASHLLGYLRAWEWAAHDDSAQLHAAYQQVQQLTCALLHSMTDHATATLDFLDAAHRQLHLDQGYSLLLHQLLTHADAIRTALRSPPLPSQETTASALLVSPSAMMQLATVAVALFAYVLLPLHSLTLSLVSLCTHLLLPYVVAVLATLLLFVGLEEKRKQKERVDEVQALLEVKAAIAAKMTPAGGAVDTAAA